jgi:ATP/maltotriose-dependent transcriptional regulator MalT/DNA-binding SARP family transcriptional activator
VAVVAGAGYGKTTLLTQVLERTTAPSVWLSCDERLASSRAFLAHLATGIETRFPGVASAIDLSGNPEQAVTALSNEVLATISDDFVLFVDDVHVLAGGGAQRALALLVSDLPPTAHLALASRVTLPLPMGRRRATGVLELGEDALALSEDEADDLLRSLRLRTPREDLIRLHRQTEGWAAGLVLAARADALALQSDASEGRSPHLDYLADEVLGRLDQETRAFMLETSVLERFTPALAETLTQRVDARRTIAALVASHLFIVRLSSGGEWYRYHHLVLALLRQQLAETRPEEIRDLHRRAGIAWLDLGEPSEAVPHLLEAEEPELAAAALEPVAEQMVTTPEADSLAAWLEQIPSDIASNRPGLVLAQAWLLLGRSEHEAAFAALERAIEELLAVGEQERAAVAFFRLLAGLTAMGVNPHVRGLEARRRFLDRIRPEMRMLPPARIMLATSFAYAGRYEEAEAELAAALELPAAGGFRALHVYADANRAFFISHYRGRSLEALAVLDAAIAWLEAHQSEDELAYLGWACAYRGVLLGHLGRWDEALRAADRWEAELERSGQVAVAGTASWMRFQALCELGRWEELEARLVQAQPFAARVPGSLFAIRHHVGAAQLEAHGGDAAAVARRVEAVSNRELPRFYRSMLLADLATAAAHVGLIEPARELLARSRHDAVEARAPWALARAAVLGAGLAESSAVEDALIGEALDASANLDNDELWSGRERALAAPLLARALDAGIGPAGAAERLLAACGGEVLSHAAERLASSPPATRIRLASALGEAGIVEPSLVRRLASDRDDGVRRAAEVAKARLAARTRPPIAITTLGAFAVRRAGSEVPLLAGGRGGKARVLLAILVAADGPVHREALLEWLWPHLNPERGLASLHTNLHTLRQALEPSLSAAGPTLLVTEGESYRLALAPDDQWDADSFRRLAEVADSADSAETALHALLAAEALAEGTFLPEWPYEDWAAPLRLEIERRQRTVLERLAEMLVAAGEPHSGAIRFERLVAIDPERESWHRGLMRAYALAGERGLALRQYHACRTILREQFGIEPSDETRGLYATLL